MCYSFCFSVTKGYPVPNISWTFNNTILVNTSTLHIANITLINAGNYTCIAKNDAGQDERTVQIIVRGKIIKLNTKHSEILLFLITSFRSSLLNQNPW